jgi:hypothetical protein
LHEVKSVYPWEEKVEEILHEIDNLPAGRRKNALLQKLENGLSVFPDIIIHHRGTKDNLVVFEVKKTTFNGEDDDYNKLQAYLHDLKYKYAFKITLPTGHDFGVLPDEFFEAYMNERPPFFSKYIEIIE